MKKADYSTLRIALVSDEPTRCCLQDVSHIFNLTPLNYRMVLRRHRPDLLLVESAWHGYRDRWRYKIASYPGHPLRSNRILRRMVACAKDLGIPTVFWNKEDGVHFERFIDSARLFDHVFTVDSNCTERYVNYLPRSSTIHALPFAVQPSIHSFSGFDFKYKRANFVGSYSHHVHDRRRAWQDVLFGAIYGLGVTVFDRNSGRRSSNYRYPEFRNMDVRPAIPHIDTANIYKDFLVSLNVNTIEDSPTMFSRRLVEILACGGICVTTPAKSVDSLFKEYCHVVTSAEEAEALFCRFLQGPSSDDLERARAGAEYVLSEHTWTHRLSEIAQVADLRS